MQTLDIWWTPFTICPRPENLNLPFACKLMTNFHHVPLNHLTGILFNQRYFLSPCANLSGLAKKSCTDSERTLLKGNYMPSDLMSFRWREQKCQKQRKPEGAYFCPKIAHEVNGKKYTESRSMTHSKGRRKVRDEPNRDTCKLAAQIHISRRGSGRSYFLNGASDKGAKDWNRED